MNLVPNRIAPFDIPGLCGGLSKGTLISPQIGLPLVLMAHSTGNDHKYPWANIVECFVASGFQVAVFDLPGHGSQSTDLLTEDAANAIEGALLELSKITKWSKLFGLGQSLGGALLLKAASNKNLNFLKISVWGLPSGREIDFRACFEILSPLFISTWALPTYYGLWGSIPALFHFKRSSYPIRMNHPSYVEFVLTVIQRSIEQLKPSQSPPCQFILGSYDFIADKEQCETLAKQIKNSFIQKVAETHFSLLCSEVAADHAIEWFLRKDS
jgi:pimeloyl-ACP methyl ester carboxylesterase